jgi:putative spermidine/putrescine transport system ATP-binding protein
MSSFLSIRGFRKTFGDFVAVDHVNLEIPKGEFLTFLGPSGSGKSTTLYAIAGFENPSAGDVLLNGQSMLQTPPHQRNIGMVFQRYTLFPHLSVFENVAFPLRVRKQGEAAIKKKVADMLALVRLGEFAHRLPAQLSGGQQQRVALARAMAYDPPVLLMDEPLSALDKKLREELQIEIRRIHQETGVTILYVTHDQEEALRLSDRIAVFNRGKIEQIGTGKELYVNPATRFVAGFIGDSNFLKVKDARIAGGKATVTLPDGTLFSDVQVHAETAGGGASEIMVRPQALRIAAAGEPSLAVAVKDVTFLGDTTSLLLETRWGQQFWMRSNVRQLASAAVGETLQVTWQVSDCHLFGS